MPVIHYSGALRFIDSQGARVTISSGFAACCTGQRTRAIRASGRLSALPISVTCKRCLALLERAREFGSYPRGLVVRQ